MSSSVLHEILAVEGDAEGNARRVLQEAKNTFSDKPNHLTNMLCRFESCSLHQF